MDISKCKNNKCPLKEHCYRWTSPADPFWQSYSDFKFRILEDGKVDCDYYWGNKSMRDKIKIKKDDTVR